MSDMAQAYRVADFVMPTAQAAQYFARSLLDIANQFPARDGNSKESAIGEDLMCNRLQEKLDMIERSQC